MGVELWKKAWQEGFRPLLTDEQVAALRKALEEDDPRLLQGGTTTPPPLMCVQDWECEAACAVGFCGWQGGDDLKTVGNVEEFFAKKCYEADQNLGEPAGCRYFLNWFDETPRDQMRREFLAMLDEEEVKPKFAFAVRK